jgi:hypothetical protein
MPANPVVQWASKDRYGRCFVEVLELPQAPLGYGLQAERDCVEGSADWKFANVSSTRPAALDRKFPSHPPKSM